MPKKIGGKERKIKTNGCGIEGYIFNLDEMGFFGFDECCNQHDKCFSICRASKEKCDFELFLCLSKKCSNEYCLTIVDFLFYLVNDFGCKPFLNSQKNVCVCRIKF